MKAIKTFLTAAFVAAAMPLSAALPTEAKFSPADSIGFDEEVNIIFSTGEGQTLDSPLYVKAYTIGGTGFGKTPDYTENDVNDGKMTLPVTEVNWGFPMYGKYTLFISLIICDEDFNPIEDEEGNLLAFEKSYQRSIEGSAKCILEYPNSHNWEEDGVSFESFYEEGNCIFYFTKEVSLIEGSFCEVEYYDAGGELMDTVIIDRSYLEREVGYDRHSGLYAVSIRIPNDLYKASELSKIIVRLTGVESDGETVDVPPIVAVNNDGSVRNVPMRIKSAPGADLSTGTDEVDVYSMQGVLIRRGMSPSALPELPSGMYIVNGNKVMIK